MAPHPATSPRHHWLPSNSGNEPADTDAKKSVLLLPMSQEPALVLDLLSIIQKGKEFSHYKKNLLLTNQLHHYKPHTTK